MWGVDRKFRPEGHCLVSRFFFLNVFRFLAHLSIRPPSSVVRLSVCRPHFLNIFSSETTWLIKVKFHMEPQRNGGTKICSNGPSHMTKVAAMPIYGKNLKKSSSPESKGRWPWNLVCCIGCSSTTKFIQMVTLGWPWLILRQGQIWSLMPLYEKKVKQWLSCRLWFETSNRWPTWQEVSVDIKSLSLGGCMLPAPGLYTCIKSWNKIV